MQLMQEQCQIHSPFCIQCALRERAKTVNIFGISVIEHIGIGLSRIEFEFNQVIYE